MKTFNVTSSSISSIFCCYNDNFFPPIKQHVFHLPKMATYFADDFQLWSGNQKNLRCANIKNISLLHLKIQCYVLGPILKLSL